METRYCRVWSGSGLGLTHLFGQGLVQDGDQVLQGSFGVELAGVLWRTSLLRGLVQDRRHFQSGRPGLLRLINRYHVTLFYHCLYWDVCFKNSSVEKYGGLLGTNFSNCEEGIWEQKVLKKKDRSIWKVACVIMQ